MVICSDLLSSFCWTQNKQTNQEKTKENQNIKQNTTEVSNASKGSDSLGTEVY